MPEYIIFTHVVGTFIFDEHFNIKESILFNKKEDYLHRESVEARLRKNFHAASPTKDQTKKILTTLKDKKYVKTLIDINRELTKDLLRNSVKEDQLIFQTISTIEDLDKITNLLIKRLREWYGYYNPEASATIHDNHTFAELIVSYAIKKDKDSIGSDLAKEHLEPIVMLAKKINELFELRNKEESYLSTIITLYCPNTVALAGVTISAKLLQKAGSLKKLSQFPSSTVQVLGAEKALFRHLKNKKNTSPRYGYLHEHPLISKVKNKDKGKAARMLAEKISIAAKIDYFKGKFIGDELKKGLEGRFGSW